MEISQVKDWLDTQEIENGVFKSHKAALVRSSDPFGLFACYRDADGVEYWYVNGKIDSVDYNGKTIRYK